MTSNHFYVGLLDGRQKTFAVLRIRDSVEEIHVPERGWEAADPRWRDWFMNVPLESGQALGLLHSLEPVELREDMDPYPHALSRDAAEGFGTQWFYYAVETDGHPLDDPLSLVRLHYPSRSESSFKPNLVWDAEPVPGRRVRISEEELRRLEEVLIRRAFGGAEVQHYAVVNPFYPDAGHPAAIVRVGPDGEQRYAGNGEWVTTSVVAHVRGRHRHGELVLLSEEAATRLADGWQPHPDSSRVRHFAWLTADGSPTAVMRAWDEDGGVEEQSYVDGVWGGRRTCLFSNEQGRVEVDQQTAHRLGAILDQRVEGGGPEDGRYEHFYAILRDEFADVSTARDLVRTWGGSDGHSHEQSFYPRINGWRWCMTVYDIRTDRNSNYAVPISPEVAEELQRVWLATAAGQAPPRRPLGRWAGFGTVTFTQVDDELLDSVRQVGDPRADSVVADVYRRGEVDRVNELLAGFVRNGDKVPHGLPLLLEQYFGQVVLPQWAERAVLARGQELWDLYAPHLAAALYCYALPVRYGMRVHHLHRELESTRLLRDVLADGGLSEPDGRGLRTVQKVRLLQAATRRLAGGGVATQEELAATACTLSVHLAQGLRSSFVSLPERDRDDLFHIFSVVGHLLGVDLRLSPVTYDEGVTVVDLIGRRRRARSVAGDELTAALERRVEAALPPGLAGVFPELVRSVCVFDPQVPDLVGIAAIDLVKWLGYLEPITAAAGLPAGSIVDDRVWRRTTSEVVGKALLAAEREADLALPPG